MMIGGLYMACEREAITTGELTSKVKPRTCVEVTQTYVNGIKSLAAAELSVMPGSVLVGLAELTTPTSGLWH
jgi:hypothetical protein